MRSARWALALVLLLALAVRLREPLSSPILGAEDPFLHMAQAWDVAQGHGLPAHYPPGFPVLLAPLTLLGTKAFVLFARFAPPLFGVAEALGIYVLLEKRLGAWPALSGALVAALMPENVFRTDLLFPTALDLALLPFVLHLTLRASEGSRHAVWGAAGLAALLLVTHPWVVALLVPTLGAFALVLALRSRRRHAAPLAAATATGGIALAAALSFLPGTWNPMPAFLRHAGPKLVALATHPASIFPLPPYVDLPAMLTWPALALAGVGAVRALAKPRRLGLLALIWCAMLLPLVLVDWFGVWFIPHRTVAYLSIGVAILAAHAVEALVVAMPRRARVPAGAAACVAVAALLVPSAAAVAPWYRVVGPSDEAAWSALDARHPSLVVTTSWQAAAGYRATTGREAVYDPSFFHDAGERSRTLAQHPDLVVYVDGHAKENGLPTGFLGGRKKVGAWGDVACYQKS
ncbi:MAG: hypothetical protein QOE90_69 [Thermoplasmata archaeon]|nr:hypothetical protein [Thermoplasmata archaeon]